jgi:ethanolamine ammonia-lyase small subunit
MNDPWDGLRKFTSARIAQGRAGSGVPTRPMLEFQYAHACARDAVHQPWHVELFHSQLKQSGEYALILNSAINNRVEYLQRPDKGRCLDQSGVNLLGSAAATPLDVALVLSNGLSSTAVDKHGMSLLMAIVEAFRDSAFKLGPICLIPNARVAISDQVGALLKARLAVIIIGERPGLSAADSLGVYLTYAPRIGNTDAQRNCLSNIREPEGLTYRAAAAKLLYLGSEALRRGISGVTLKDEMPMNWLAETSHQLK